LATVVAAHVEQESMGPAWWCDDSILRASTAAENAAAPRQANFRFGSGLLQVHASDDDLLSRIDQFYGECSVDVQIGTPSVRCTLTRPNRDTLVRIDCVEGIPPDAAASALALLHPPHGRGRYAIADAPRPGWKTVGATGSAVLVASGGTVIFDQSQVPGDFLADFLVATALQAQTELIVVHAAAAAVAGRGFLLSGASHAGKTTTAAQLATIGHTLLGDEMALIRFASRELFPLRRAMRLRRGPRTAGLTAALRRAGIAEDAGGARTRPVRIDHLFPGSSAEPVPLCAVFLLDGFRAFPSLEAFTPTLDDTDVFDVLSANDIALISWGLAPRQRTLRLLALNHLLGRLPCWRLMAGAPDATAKLIEETMEKL
jgi:hypothetical protein